MKQFIFFLSIIFTTQSQQKYSIELKDAFPQISNFNRPVHLTHANDNSERIFVVEQEGRIWSFENKESARKKILFLDIRDRVDDSGNEMGLLSVAFHPNFASNKYFFVNYTAANPMRTVISRFTVSSKNNSFADPKSEKIILEINQPYSNHNGGLNLFGPDGFLYIGMGDGGWAGDPHNNAQNLKSLLGKMLRINVDSIDGKINYSIPSDNPFVNFENARKEIWAFGLRNPWRFSFDLENNFLYCADVGQNQWEEIDIIRKGENYGWRCYEGTNKYDLSKCNTTENFTMPIKEYTRAEGESITGGVVYRGKIFPDLFGAYIYADFIKGNIWLLRYDGKNILEEGLLIDSPHLISSFGEDEQNEIYICSFDGRIYKFNK